MHMNQIERIKYMEELFDFVLAAKEHSSIFQERCEEVENAMLVLSDYYGSEVWKQDFADDEAGLLPKDLKRGVLSEDGLWNLLSDRQE